MTAQTSSPSSKRPITAHPHFPTGIGVWFAVLFSLSSLAIRGSLLEALVVVTHIDYLFPAASPPLGAVPPPGGGLGGRGRDLEAPIGAARLPQPVGPGLCPRP